LLIIYHLQLLLYDSPFQFPTTAPWTVAASPMMIQLAMASTTPPLHEVVRASPMTFLLGMASLKTILKGMPSP
jgi:hypothetical protein